jgi:hypothetical protein
MPCATTAPCWPTPTRFARCLTEHPTCCVWRSTPAQLQDALDDCTLQHWISKTQALPSQFESARHAAVTLLKPNVVHVLLPKRTLNNDAELKVWLAEVEQLLAEQIKQGPVAL